jgi:nicotinamide-nucleotide amidase
LRAEIIAVGTELLLGHTLNTHASFLSRECSELGIGVYYHITVGDNRDRLKEVIRTARERSDLVILTGGLGPTEDDLTKETVAEVLGIELVEHPPTRRWIEDLFRQRGMPVPSGNYKQALVFPQGTVFPNDRGTAPGLAVTHEGVTYVMLPGPPHELIPMFEKQVKPFLISLLPEKEVIHSQVLRFFGIGESHLEERIKDLIDRQNNPTIAPYAKRGEVTIRLTAKASNVQEAEERIAPVRQAILERVGAYCYSERDEMLEQVTVNQLRDRGQTLALAESCTGGLVAQMITSVPGASEVFKGGVVCYTNEAKEWLLQVPRNIIDVHGAISMETACTLAEQAAQRMDADWGLSVTGVAGPSPAEGKPVGLVYVGLAERGRPVRAYRYTFRGSREDIRVRAAKQMLFLLQERIKKGELTT